MHVHRTMNPASTTPSGSQQREEFAMMKQRFHGRLLAVGLALGVLAATAAGCAKEVADIDRTQSNRVDKQQLAGVWYYLQTMIDVPQQSSQGFIGNTNFGSSAKVMFDIQEHWLYVVPVVETVKFAEAKYTKSKIRNYWDAGKSGEFVEMFIGQPIAAFPIDKHFDVIRQFNTATGAQSNVLTENDTDRPWYERKYIRVNWGGNTVQDWMFPYGSKQFSAVDHFVQQKDDPYLDAPGQGANPDAFELQDGYLAFVTKAFLPPNEVDWQGESCNPYMISNKDCGGATIKVRHSFKHAPTWSDYETFVYKNSEHMDKFGFFLSERYSYDEYWNLTETGKDYKAQLWPLWKSVYDTKPILDKDGKAVSCMADSDCGSDADVMDRNTVKCVKDHWFHAGTCHTATLKPFRERGLKPILYHFNSNVQDELRSEFYETADGWSDVYKETVAWLYTLEDIGRYWVRDCKVDSDCTANRQDVIGEVQVDLPKQMQAKAEDTNDCAKVNGGNVNGLCVQGVACSALTPCAANQICSGGSCHVRNGDGTAGDKVTVPVNVPGPKIVTLVIHAGADGKAAAIRVNNDVSGKQIGGSEAAVQFVNATPGSSPTNLTLDDGTEVAPAAAYDANAWVSAVYTMPAGSPINLKAGTATLAITPEKGSLYVVAFTGGDTLVGAGATINNSLTGVVRVLHAVKGKGEADLGIGGVKKAAKLPFGGLSEFSPSRLDKERIVLVQGGTEGDVSCYHTMHVGKCVGWAGDWPTDFDARLAANKQSVPEMFLMCENVYDRATAETKANDAAGKALKNVGNDGRYASRGKNPYAPAGKQDLSNANELYNPCERMVPDATKLKKIGDVRYSYMYWVAEMQAASPWGYGPSAADPESGETFWATAYVYGAPTFTIGYQNKDLVDLLNGKLDPNDIITGKYVRDYVERKGDPIPMDNSATMHFGAAAAPAEGVATARGRVSQIDDDGKFLKLSNPLKDAPELIKFMNDPKFRKELFADLPTVQTGWAQNRMDKIRGTHIEDLMLNDEVVLGLTDGQVLPGQGLSAELRKQLSPATWATGEAVMAKNHKQHNHLARGPCAVGRDFQDDTIYGLAKEFACTDDERLQYKAGTLTGKMCLEGDELFWEITRRIFGGVVEHEVGHNMGLRHNFSGSVDVFNFFDDYYKIREKESVYCQNEAHCDSDYGEVCTVPDCKGASDCPAGLSCNTSNGKCVDSTTTATGTCTLNGVEQKKFVPSIASSSPARADRVYTDKERQEKLYEYQYSTVMDYGGRLNSDIHGLGKYDYAAIKFAYGRMVEVYRNTDKIRNRVYKAAADTGYDPSQFAWYLDTSSWRYAGVVFHPFFYLENYIGAEDNLKRVSVPYNKVKWEHAIADNYKDNELNWTYLEVPYRFCSDEFNGNLGCYTYDVGIDVGETVVNAVNSINEYYVFDAFMRDRQFAGSQAVINGYFGRVMGRFLNILHDAGRYFAIYDHIFRKYSWYPELAKNPHGMRTLVQASHRSFNELAQMLAAPAPGSFRLDSQDNIYRNVSYDLNAPNTDLTIPVGIGKFPYTQYLQTDSNQFYDHVLWVGSYWLRLAALLTLTDSTFQSASDWVGEQLAIGRSSAVGFNTLYQTQMTNLIGGIVADNVSYYTATAGKDSAGNLIFRARDLFNPQVGKNERMVEPGLNNLSIKLNAATLGMANLPAGFDPSFTDSMTVFLKGSGEEFTLAKGDSAVKIGEFEDPWGKKTYMAYAPNYDDDRVPPAYTIIARANSLKTAWAAANGDEKTQLATKLKEQIQILDILRQLHVMYGNLVY